MADQFGNLGTLSPEDYAQQQQINRQQKMAEMLMAQNQQPQGQMVSGRYVAPSFFQNLQPIANMLTGAYMAKQGDVQAAKLAEAIRGRNATEAQDIIQTLQGTSNYKPAQMPQIQRDDMGNVMPAIEQQVGQAPDKQAALLKALKSTSPVGQMVANSLITKSLEGPKFHNIAQGASLLQETPDGIKSVFTNPKEMKIPDAVEIAAYRLGINPNPSTWTPEQRKAIDEKILQDKKAGAPVTTNINTVMGKSLADVGPILKDSMIAAQGAIQSNDSVDRIINAASDKGFYGPSANVQLFAAQLADKAGLGGKDNPTKIKNTRDAVQGLAQLVLQGRKQMRGEGSITQGENTLAEKAISGDIGNLTAAEIIQLANAAKRVNNYTISSHEQKIKYAKSNPETAVSAPYYEVPYYNNSGVQYLGPVR
jgi:hypothetical protein